LPPGIGPSRKGFSVMDRTRCAAARSVDRGAERGGEECSDMGNFLGLDDTPQKIAAKERPFRLLRICALTLRLAGDGVGGLFRPGRSGMEDGDSDALRPAPK
jgi:hypothetical protein